MHFYNNVVNFVSTASFGFIKNITVKVLNLQTTTKTGHAKRLNHFHLSCPIRWQNKIPDIDNDAKHTYTFKACTARMDWPCYKNV